MFIDKVKIYVQSGKGGDGCISFRRERFIPKGGPDGGDGGKGGNVILKVDNNQNNFRDLKFNQHCKAKNGLPGQGSRKNGSHGEDKIVFVPQGTLVKDFETQAILADLIKIGQEFLAVHGGDGGAGNRKYMSSTNQAPRMYTQGKMGIHRTLFLELKTIADIALVGYPNAGKSTFFNWATDNSRETAPYPFTTITPLVGRVIFDDYEEFTIADIPGLIKGAHKNVGLGFEFLRHIERANILVYVIDMSKNSEKETPFYVFESLHKELSLYQDGLEKKVQLILANKMDEDLSKEQIEKFKESCDIPIVSITAELGENCQESLSFMRKLIFKFREKEHLEQAHTKKIIVQLEDDDFI